jgi:valyl-tRNA synthetase
LVARTQSTNRAIIGFDGRLLTTAPEAIAESEGAELWDELAGKTVFSAKELIVGWLAERRRHGWRTQAH